MSTPPWLKEARTRESRNRFTQPKARLRRFPVCPNSLGLESCKDPREDRIMPRRSVFKRRVVRVRGRKVVARIVYGLLGHIAVERTVIRHQGIVRVIGGALSRDTNLERI